MRNRSVIDSIDDYKLVVYLSIYREWGLDPLQTDFRANPTNLANNRSTKLGTLICSALARTVRPIGADPPVLNLVPNICPLPFGGAEQTKSILTQCDYIGFLKHLATY
jgi:hypothetical protein